MFGVALRSYQLKLQRLQESASEDGVTRWSAVRTFVEGRGSVTRSEASESQAKLALCGENAAASGACLVGCTVDADCASGNPASAARVYRRARDRRCPGILRRSWWSRANNSSKTRRVLGSDLSRTQFADIEAWAEHYVLSSDLRVKLAPPPVPAQFRSGAAPVRLEHPGRPPELRLARRGERTPKAEALKAPHYRARLLHSFWHHELQAAELMCWAVLAFSDAEPEFRKGLIGICLDEIRHMNLYRQHIEALGEHLGAFGVRDWFWKRVPSCPTKVAFVALMGMGLEAANLEHAPSFAALLRGAGDEKGAQIQEQIGREELAHVRFGTRWFTRWTGGCRFEDWMAQLPPPLSPWVLKAEPLAREARLRAGMPEAFLAALAAYVPERKGRPSPASEPTE